MKERLMSERQAVSERQRGRIPCASLASSEPRFRSLVYGLGVEANLPIPGTLPGFGDSVVDMWVWFNTAPPWSLERIQSRQQLYHVSPY